MDQKPKYAMQAGGMCHLWGSRDGTFHHSFLRLDFDCEPDKYPGVVIITDENYQNAFSARVSNLQRELPSLLVRIRGKPVAYWWLEQDEHEIERILSGLTEQPVFADRR